jgi:hypothetical protein
MSHRIGYIRILFNVILPVLELLVGLDTVVALGGVSVTLVLGDLVIQLENAVLLVEKHIVVVLHLHLSHLLCHSLVFILHFISLRICKPLKLLEFLVSYKSKSVKFL